MEVKTVNVVDKIVRVVSFEYPLTIAKRYRYKVNIGEKADKTTV